MAIYKIKERECELMQGCKQWENQNNCRLWAGHILRPISYAYIDRNTDRQTGVDIDVETEIEINRDRGRDRDRDRGRIRNRDRDRDGWDG